MEVMSWIPPYYIERAMQTLRSCAWEGPNPNNVINRIGLQYWGPDIFGNASLVRHEGLHPTENDVETSVAFCRERGIAPMLCLYNYDGDWNWNLARNAFINEPQRLIDSLLEQVEQYQLSGVDIDFEGKESHPGDRQLFASWIHQLAEELHRRGKQLTINLFHGTEETIPNITWIPDWVEQIDAVRSMGYTELYEGAPSLRSYSEQQRLCTRAMGLPPEKFFIGLPGWVSGWGRGGEGSHLLNHLQELFSLPQPTNICIWDAALTGDAWRTPEVWALLAALQVRAE